MQEVVIELSVPNLTNEMKVQKMNDKYVKLADVKRKLRYIFKAYGVGGFVREKVERSLNNLPYSVKGDLETTLETADVQPVKHGKWEKKKGYLVCSNCGMTVDTIGYTYEEQEEVFRYCSCCGYRMDGEQNG